MSTRIGDPFNPWRGSCGFYPPDMVGRQKGLLTDGQKRLYERLVRRAGKNGACFPSFVCLADDLGKSLRQVKSDMAALEELGLIAHVRHGRRMANSYQFLWHAILEGEVQPTAPHPEDEVQPDALQEPGGEVQDTHSEVQPTAPSEVQPTAPEFSHLNSVHGISSSSEAGVVVQDAMTPEVVNDDDEAPFTETNNATPDLVRAARECLHMARCCNGLGIPSERVDVVPPDGNITRQILRQFRCYEHFETWLYDTIKRGLQRKVRAGGYGLYLRDAQNFAPDAAERWEAEEGERRVMAAREKEKRQQAEQERREAEGRERIANTPAAPQDAIQAVLEAGGRIPDLIRKRVVRLGVDISPAALAEMARQHQRCDKCEERGLLGTAIERTRRFCDCVAGEEKRHEDPEAPAREIERAHASLQNRLAAAADAKGWSFIKEAIENSMIMERETDVLIEAGRIDCAFLELRDKPSVELVRCMEMAGETRPVQVIAARKAVA